MTAVHAAPALALVLLATCAGILGTGLMYIALVDQEPGALAWGLPLALGGLYWCGRALAQGHRALRQRRLGRNGGPPA